MYIYPYGLPVDCPRQAPVPAAPPHNLNVFEHFSQALLGLPAPGELGGSSAAHTARAWEGEGLPADSGLPGWQGCMGVGGSGE